MPLCCVRRQSAADLRARQLQQEFEAGLEQLYASNLATTEPDHGTQLTNCRTEVCSDYAEVVRRLKKDAEDLKAKQIDRDTAAAEADKQRAAFEAQEKEASLLVQTHKSKGEDARQALISASVAQEAAQAKYSAVKQKYDTMIAKSQTLSCSQTQS
eukprot:NODE_7815_length_741_cov_117.961165_g7564_i0.p1 GENE.NODE_7815_length_741_cov_117.961165_g7564_i0~~NODE_7815_length_741_cov_117.961165_g7564_i0.p1  ORF type:complete len:156 (+),score=45.37 NODE_7815_length_741_cov_117.961165_g7564_i0:62-529(+)